MVAATVVEKGYTHHHDVGFGKSMEGVMHDLTLTDGAARLYSHMHWRYGSNHKNYEGRASMSDFMGVTETTITNRVKELVARDWVIVIPQYDDRGRITNFYHVFEEQNDCRKWQNDHNYEKQVIKFQERKQRKGIGGRPTHKVKEDGSEETQVSIPVSELEFPTVGNSSSRRYPDSYYPDSLNTEDSSEPANAVRIEPSESHDPIPSESKAEGDQAIMSLTVEGGIEETPSKVPQKVSPLPVCPNCLGVGCGQCDDEIYNRGQAALNKERAVRENPALWDTPISEFESGAAHTTLLPHALTVKRQYAERIGTGVKDYEIRNFKTDYRGQLVFTVSGEQIAYCVVDLVDIIPAHTRIDIPADELAYGKWAWILKNPRYLEPVPCKGKQGLWTWEGELPPIIAAPTERRVAAGRGAGAKGKAKPTKAPCYSNDDIFNTLAEVFFDAVDPVDVTAVGGRVGPLREALLDHVLAKRGETDLTEDAIKMLCAHIRGFGKWRDANKINWQNKKPLTYHTWGALSPAWLEYCKSDEAKLINHPTPTTKPCEACAGRGATFSGSTAIQCTVCNGKGKVAA